MARHSSDRLRSGRVIGERREKLETASERTAAHKKIKRQQFSRVFFTVLGFAAVAVLLFIIGNFIVSGADEKPAPVVSAALPYEPTIEIIDEDAGANSFISSRMKDYIGQAEFDFRALGYVPVKAVLPAGAIREVDFYLDGYPGYIKMILDRPTATSVEDADRMIRYLASHDIETWQYIDVRIEGGDNGNQAYWK